ncbi:MAG: hypothetical protein ACM31C_21690 [Acidobacteriota bacterium]
MTKLVGLAAVLVGIAVTARAASADVEVRDHRAEAAPAPAVGRTYRKRPGPRFMLPLQIDIGATGSNTSRGFAPGMAAAIGIHWASLSPQPTDTDVGIGVFGALLGAPADPAMTTTDNTVAYGGAYLEAGHTLSRGDFFRTWASARGEYLGSTAFGVDHKGFGGSVRLSAELFTSGVGIEPRGIFVGTYAVGLYAEAGVHDVAPGLSDFQATAGLTIRTPFVFSP